MNRLEISRRNNEILRKMYEEGATVDEMMEATGYKRSTVFGIIARFKETPMDVLLESCEFATHPIPLTPVVEYDGKKYIDVTELLLSSEWRM